MKEQHWLSRSECEMTGLWMLRIFAQYPAKKRGMVELIKDCAKTGRFLHQSRANTLQMTFVTILIRRE
jgi:hypothetical protein